jgi:cation:H+ antiporter
MIDLILFMWIGIFIVSLGVLIKSSDYFTESSEKIGIHFGIPAFIVGVTIVAFGTSLPELVSSLIAVFAGSSEIVAANVIGSNIANILLVLGIAAIIAKSFTISHEIESVDLPLLICSAFLLFMMSLDGKFTFGEGVIMLLGIVLYIMYAISSHKESESKKDNKIKDVKKEKLGFSVWAVLVVSIFFIFVGAKYTIDSVIIISDMLNIGKDIIAVIAVALGTSLPELMVTVSAARKGNAEMAVGNVLGSNIFNSFMVMGIPALFAPWFVSEGYLKVSTELIGFALPIMVIATLLYVFMTRDKKITQWEGWTLLLVYVFFVFSTFGLV